jgi:hypothetical protein
MRLPSVKTLATITNNRADAKLIRRVLVLYDSRDATDGDAWRDLATCDPRWSAVEIPFRTRGHDSHRVRLALEFADRILGTCGVESAIDDPHGFDPHNGPDYSIDYCNAGDPYVATLCYVTASRSNYWTVAGYGDILERLERRGAKFA